MPMRPVQIRMAADGPSAWVPLNRYAINPVVQLGVIFSSNKNLTAAVEYTTDPLEDQLCNITRSTTTATLTLRNHGLSTGDSIVVSGAGSTLDGTFAVASVTDQNVITYTVANSGLTSVTGAKVKPLRIAVHATLTALTADAYAALTAPVSAIRLVVSSYVAGYVDLDIIPGSK